MVCLLGLRIIFTFALHYVETIITVMFILHEHTATSFLRKVKEYGRQELLYSYMLMIN